MSLLEFITAVVAVYGAGLSTYVFLVERRDKKRRLKVGVSYGFLTFGPSLSDQMIFLEAVNTGSRPVFLDAPYLLLPDNKTIVFPTSSGDVNFPHELHAGRSCKIWVPLNELSAALIREGYGSDVQLAACYRDQMGTRFRSKKFRFSLGD